MFLRSVVSRATLTGILGCVSVFAAAGAPVSAAAKASAASQSLDWDAAFRTPADPRPLHFVAIYRDPRGQHRLEEWRLADQHLRRLTDARIDLHADRVAAQKDRQNADYQWQVIDRERKIVHRMNTQVMLQAGMLYNFYAMAHVLHRPAGRFTLATTDHSLEQIAGESCTWFLLSPDDQPASRICWSPAATIPLSMEEQGKDGTWSNVFLVQQLDRRPIPAATFNVDPTGLQIRNVGDLQQED